MKLLLMRRVAGKSMVPEYGPGRLVFATGLRKVDVGRVVVAEWRGKEVLKRVLFMDGEDIRLGGDNRSDSLSLSVKRGDILGTVI